MFLYHLSAGSFCPRESSVRLPSLACTEPAVAVSFTQLAMVELLQAAALIV
jgi:hypothetical protein